MGNKSDNLYSEDDILEALNIVKERNNHSQTIPCINSDELIQFQLNGFESYRWISDKFKFIGIYNYNDLPTDAVCGDICRVICPKFVTDYAGNEIKNHDFIVRTRKGWLKLEKKIDKKKNNISDQDYIISIIDKFGRYFSNPITLSINELSVLNKFIKSFPSLEIKIISLDDLISRNDKKICY